jgi:predicted RNA-binding protein with PUA-like domain
VSRDELRNFPPGASEPGEKETLSMAYWLMKSEPHVYSWDDLVRDQATDWDGVRNNAARLHLRAMQPGDEAFFYHSGDEKQVVGIMRITGTGKPDGEDGAWVKVPVAPVRALSPVTLKQVKAEPSLAAMELIRQSRLSVSPVRAEEWAKVLAMAGEG